jgi:hypothetical protein
VDGIFYVKKSDKTILKVNNKMRKLMKWYGHEMLESELFGISLDSVQEYRLLSQAERVYHLLM